MADCVLVSSFSPFTVRSARQRFPAAVPVALLRERRSTRVFHSLLRTAADHPEHTLVDEALLAWARRKGLRVNVWTVNDVAEGRRLAGLGVHGIITNIPGVMRAALA